MTSTCSAVYKSLHYNLNEVYIYAFGNGKCIVDGSPAPTIEYFATRHFVANGSRDTSWSLIVKNDADDDVA